MEKFHQVIRVLLAMAYKSVLRNNINGRLTYRNGNYRSDCYEVAKPQFSQSNTWSSTENNSTNSWNVNFGTGNVNNNNKYNSNVVRPVTASMDSKEWADYIAFANRCRESVPTDFMMTIYEAYQDCCRGKMSSTQCMEYVSSESDYDLYILAWQIWTDKYYPSTSTCFLVRYPKWREVFAANFRDRIVHHWLCMHINPLFEQRFVEQGNVSFNCRKGFGNESAVMSVSGGIKRVTNNYHRQAWIFKGDLVGFFMSIDKDVMWHLMYRFLKRKYKGKYADIVFRTAKIIIYHRPEKDCVLNSQPHLWKNLSSNKSLHRTPPNKGMAIGNLTTQLFANFYMSFFDAYVQFIFRRHDYHYARFVDDFILVCSDRRFLLKSIHKLRNYLSSVLHLSSHKNKHYFQSASHGVLFVGSYIKNGRIYLSNRTRSRMTERVHGFSHYLSLNYTLTKHDCKHIQGVLNSYLGFTRRRRTYSFRKYLLSELLNTVGFNNYYFVYGHYETIKIKNKFT